MASTQKRITQKQLAQQLGISQPLVSMVLNGRREGISKQRFKMIWNAAVEAGYSPRGMDVSQVFTSHEKMTQEIGIILRSGVKLNMDSNYFNHIYQGVHAMAIKNETCTILIGSEDDFSTDKIIEIVKEKNLLGLLVLGEIHPQLMFKLKNVISNIVALSAEYPGFCDSIISNEEQAVNQLVDYFYNSGHRNFAWLGGDTRLGRHQARFNSLLMSLRSHNLLLLEKNCVDMENADKLDGREAMQILIDRLGRDSLPSAIITHNGNMARGAINLLLQKQIKVPDIVNIGAIDMTRVLLDERPKITGASADPEKIGEMGVKHLLRMIASQTTSDSPKQIILDSVLKIRESTTLNKKTSGK